MWNRLELKQNAKGVLKRNYWKVFLASVIIYITTYVSQFFTNFSDNILDIYNRLGYKVNNSNYTKALMILFIINITTFFLIYAFNCFINKPFSIGSTKLLLNCKNDTANYNDIIFGFKNNYLNIVKTMFFQTLYIDLWSLLFIIPGIIKSYEYRMVPYLLAEHPDMNWKNALNASKEMMNGQKWNAFVLDMSFIGWHLLGLLTCGIVEVFYVKPYNLLTNAELYYALKKE